MKRPHGNGSGKFEIGHHDMGGWVRIVAGRQNLPDDLPVYLSHTLALPPLSLAWSWVHRIALATSVAICLILALGSRQQPFAA
jgi:hypothetical protein